MHLLEASVTIEAGDSSVPHRFRAGDAGLKAEAGHDGHFVVLRFEATESGDTAEIDLSDALWQALVEQIRAVG